jgi:hypothetical protein
MCELSRSVAEHWVLIVHVILGLLLHLLRLHFLSLPFQDLQFSLLQLLLSPWHLSLADWYHATLVSTFSFTLLPKRKQCLPFTKPELSPQLILTCWQASGALSCPVAEGSTQREKWEGE